MEPWDKDSWLVGRQTGTSRERQKMEKTGRRTLGEKREIGHRSRHSGAYRLGTEGKGGHRGRETQETGNRDWGWAWGKRDREAGRERPHLNQATGRLRQGK